MSPLAASLTAFTLAAALLTVTPGLDTVLVLRTTAVEGRRPALLAAAGICLGCLAWGLVAALGLGILLRASQLAYQVLRWAGAFYLLALGVQLLRARRGEIDEGAPPKREGRGLLWLRRGLLTNLLNPKVGIFYVSFLPQFIPAGASVAPTILLLAAIHAALGLFWLFLLIAAAGRLAPALRRPRTIRTLDRLTGTVLLLFGLKLALGRR